MARSRTWTDLGWGDVLTCVLLGGGSGAFVFLGLAIEPADGNPAPVSDENALAFGLAVATIAIPVLLLLGALLSNLRAIREAVASDDTDPDV